MAARVSDNAQTQISPRPASRRYELDWLRSCAVLGLIPFHAAIVFTTGSGDYVKNAETSPVLDGLAAFVTLWGMPLIFLVGGASACLALRSRAPRAYVTERLSRLAVPFLFGLFAIVPLQMYVGLIYRLRAAPPFLPFYIGHLGELLRIPTGVAPANSADWIGHLWFIPILIVFALFAIPFDWLLRRQAPQRALAAITLRRAPLTTLLLLGLPLALALTLMQTGASLAPALRPLTTWALFVLFLYFFLFGYIVYDDPRLARRIRDAAPSALLLALVSLAALEVVDRTHSAPPAAATLTFAAYSMLRGYVSWLWVAALLGYGMRLLAFSTRWLANLNEAAYPAYVLHMPILSLIALYVVTWEAPLLVKLIVIILATFAVLWCLYTLAIKRVPALRFLFGLKPLPRHSSTGTSLPPSTPPPFQEDVHEDVHEELSAPPLLSLPQARLTQ